MKVDLKIYCFSYGSNIGDMMGHYILEKYFPDIEFNPESKNYLFFGGSTFHHHKTFSVKPDYILYFGNGLSCFDELVMPDCDYKIFPRGKFTKLMLEMVGVKCEDVVGDIVQFLSSESTIQRRSPSKGDLYIKDAFKDIGYIPDGAQTIAVCDNNGLTDGHKLYQEIPKFKRKLSYHKKLVSSQIHPYLMALMWGFPTELVPKDIRAMDVTDYFHIPLDCSSLHAEQARAIAKNNVDRMRKIFLDEIKKFEITSP